LGKFRDGMKTNDDAYRSRPLRAGIAIATVSASLGLGLSALAANYVSPSTPYTYTSGCNTFSTTTINVTETTPITDLNVGLISTIGYRLDTVLDLISPDGTTVRLLNGTGPNTPRANYNVLFDDEAVNQVDVNPHDTPDDAGAAPYENPVQPSGTLSDFDGEDPSGNWTFSYCDQFPGDGGATVNRMELLFANANEADLSIATSTIDPILVGNIVTVDVTVTNIGPADATGVQARALLGAGLTFQSTTAGTYNTGTNTATLGTVPAGSTQTFSIDVLVESSGPYTFTSRIEASNQADPDSTPGNAIEAEDDQDTLTMIPGQGQTGNPPQLSCALGNPPNLLEWTPPGGAFGWTAGDITSNTFTVNGVPVTISFTGDTGGFASFNNGAATVQAPLTDDLLTGGNPGNPHSLHLATQYANVGDSITVIFEFGTPIGGVGGIQIPIYDVDLGAWTDVISVAGSQQQAGGGSPVVRTPILTGSSSNNISGSTVTGTGDSGSNSGAGNMWINFAESIDRLEITYANGSATTPPAFQFIAIGSFLYCDPETPDLTAQKTVETKVADAFSIPGESILYRITATSGVDANVDADGVVIHDVLPDNLRFVSATTTGFTGGTFNSPALPAANTDCAGGSCEINFTGATLPRGTVGEVIIEAVIK